MMMKNLRSQCLGQERKNILSPYLFGDRIIKTVSIFSQVLGIKFGIEKSALLLMRSGRRVTKEGIEIRKNQNASRKGRLQEFGNTGTGHHQTTEDERKKLRISQTNENTSRNQTMQ